MISLVLASYSTFDELITSAKETSLQSIIGAGLRQKTIPKSRFCIPLVRTRFKVASKPADRTMRLSIYQDGSTSIRHLEHFVYAQPSMNYSFDASLFSQSQTDFSALL